MSAYRKILAAVDGSTASARGLREAIRLAKAERARLALVHVVDEFQAYTPLDGAPPVLDLVPALRESGRRVLAKAEALARAQGLAPTKTLLEMVGGPAAGPIVREARRQKADLIVLGTHGRRGMRRLVLGSDAEQVVRASPVPVLLVRAPEKAARRRRGTRR